MTTSKTIAGLIGPTFVAIAASMLLNIGSFPARYPCAVKAE